MQSASSTPSYEFVAACIPYPKALGRIRTARMLETLVAKEAVVSLEKMAALRMMNIAMAAPIKRKQLIEIIRKYPISEFSPLIFGDCSAITKFILENANLHSHCCLHVSSTRVQLCLEDGKVIAREHEENEMPIDKMVEIMRVVLTKKPLEIFTSIIHEDIPDAAAIGERILRIATGIVGGRFRIVQVFIE